VAGGVKDGRFGGVRLGWKKNRGKPGVMMKGMTKGAMRKAVKSDKRRPGIIKKAR
jgi:hypothetical protein